MVMPSDEVLLGSERGKIVRLEAYNIEVGAGAVVRPFQHAQHPRRQVGEAGALQHACCVLVGLRAAPDGCSSPPPPTFPLPPLTPLARRCWSARAPRAC